MRVRTSVVLFALPLALGLATASCSSNGDKSAALTVDTAQTKNPYGAGLIDPPLPDETILTVSIESVSVEFSLNTLRKLKKTSAKVFEPFVLENTSFTGVALADLFAKVGVANVDTVKTRAINEYVYSNTARAFTESKGILAYEENGSPISVDRGGPIRLIFPDGTKLSKDVDAWNWSLESMSVG